MPITRLVLLPGMDGTGTLFEPLLDVLAAEWEPIVVRYPPDEALGYDALLEVVRACHSGRRAVRAGGRVVLRATGAVDGGAVVGRAGARAIAGGSALRVVCRLSVTVAAGGDLSSAGRSRHHQRDDPGRVVDACVCDRARAAGR